MAQMAADQVSIEQEAPESEQKQEVQGDQAGAIKLLTEKLESSFDEQTAKQLFSFYALDESTQRLQPPDVRKLLLDLLAAAQWPLVVPDESLDTVLNELCLSEEGSISWIEFKSFFVFLQDNPLTKLLDLCTKTLSKQQIIVGRLVTIRPVPAAAADNGADDKEDGDKKEDDKATANYYDRSRWLSAVQKLIPESTQIFIYFMDGYQVLALALGPFESALAEPAAAEVKLDDVAYLATIRAFDASNDMFPPIARSGGLKSKVARRIADSYLLTREWDEKHLKLVEKATVAAAAVSVKWTQFDQRFKVQETMNAATTSVIASAKGIDEKYQLTRRLSNSAKQLDEKFGISQKASSVAQKVAENERVQSVSKKVESSLKAAVKAIDDIGQETQQLVQDKRQQNLQSVEEKNSDEAEGTVANGDAASH